MEERPEYELLNRINSPADLRRLRPELLPQVCGELRRDIIDELSCNSGHFASSLGAVELIVALHYVFNTPDDRIVWDVGHQAYAHKILTGRRERFSTNRHFHGLAPFPTPKESEYDTFTCGHASNSISAALGMSVAAIKEGHPERKVVAVIGDGSMSGGLAFEGLNNASTTPNNLLIILNDNNMSIDRSVGGLKQYLLQLHTSSAYNDRLPDQLAGVLKLLGADRAGNHGGEADTQRHDYRVDQVDRALADGDRGGGVGAECPDHGGVDRLNQRDQNLLNKDWPGQHDDDEQWMLGLVRYRNNAMLHNTLLFK